MAATLIREATQEDVPLVYTLVRELAAFERLSGEVKATEEGLRAALFGERRFIEAVIAESGGEAVGFATFFHNFSTFVGKPGLWVEDIFVRPKFRGQGHGKLLFRALAGIASTRGCGRMEWSALDWNETAIGLYLEFGARKLDEWLMYRLDEAGISRLAGG
jgi:GNAT superfamily N-acetyltransferase